MRVVWRRAEREGGLEKRESVCEREKEWEEIDKLDELQHCHYNYATIQLGDTCHRTVIISSFIF